MESSNSSRNRTQIGTISIRKSARLDHIMHRERAASSRLRRAGRNSALRLLDRPPSRTMTLSWTPYPLLLLDLAILTELERKMLWLATWMIHHANHRPREFRRAESRRPSGVLRLARHHHDRALFPHAAAGRPRRGQAACGAEFSRHPISARPADARKARTFPRLQRRAILSVAHQGYRRRRFLHRLGRLGRGADVVLLARPGLRARPWLGDWKPSRKAA